MCIVLRKPYYYFCVLSGCPFFVYCHQDVIFSCTVIRIPYIYVYCHQDCHIFTYDIIKICNVIRMPYVVCTVIRIPYVFVYCNQDVVDVFCVLPSGCHPYTYTCFVYCHQDARCFVYCHQDAICSCALSLGCHMFFIAVLVLCTVLLQRFLYFAD